MLDCTADFAHRPRSSSFLWTMFLILQGNPKKELLRGLWVGGYRVQGADFGSRLPLLLPLRGIWALNALRLRFRV